MHFVSAPAAPSGCSEPQIEDQVHLQEEAPLRYSPSNNSQTIALCTLDVGIREFFFLLLKGSAVEIGIGISCQPSSALELALCCINHMGIEICAHIHLIENEVLFCCAA